jgi:hypothetical protein
MAPDVAADYGILEEGKCVRLVERREEILEKEE